MASRNGVVTTIHLDGPFFRKDPAKTFRQNVRTMMDAVAAEGAKDVVAQLAEGESRRRPVSGGVEPARVADHVVGRTHNLRGKPWQVTAVVSANRAGLGRPQAIALTAAASVLEGRIHAFRKTKGRIGRTRKTNMSELLKGIE